MVGSVLPLMNTVCEQLNGQLGKVLGQVRNLPNYQINWSAVHDVMRDLQREFHKLRRIANKCLGLVTSDEHRRIVREREQGTAVVLVSTELDEILGIAFDVGAKVENDAFAAPGREKGRDRRPIDTG